MKRFVSPSGFTKLLASRAPASSVFSLLLFTCFFASAARPTEPDGSDTLEELPIEAEDREHWSFRPLVEPPIPLVAGSDWANGPIDCFIQRELELEELTPAPLADRATLLRRLKFDLLGLPPTAQELNDFLNDSRSDAYEQWVERWLASPQFGERNAQYWLDLARFAETDGFEHDKVRGDAWKYRDWVIGALNQGLPYDRFVELQLVGDLENPQENAIATMFCLASPDMPDINEQDVRRHDRLNELTATIGSALLGLQIQCAQCHDHKYDPISQADFYRLRAVFESAVPLLKRDQPFNVFSGPRSNVQGRLYLRGDVNSPGPTLSAAFPRICVPTGADHRCDPEKPRSSFATWLFADDNPLTARVIANRVWQHHFGKGLFENSSDVGVVAGGPSHPELLDWLACFLREKSWDLKLLHREIVLSATYRQAGRQAGTQTPQEVTQSRWKERLTKDSDNDLLSRFPRQRLQGEVIRDSLLFVAGSLNSEAGGPGVMPPLPAELTGTLLKGQWKTSLEERDHHRRSIYVFARRNLRYPIFDVFDRPDAGASCPQRDQSTTAIQSLQMLNSGLSHRCATLLCERVTQSVPEEQQTNADVWVDQLFRIALSRPATQTEIRSLGELAVDEESRQSLCLAVLNANEFLYVD